MIRYGVAALGFLMAMVAGLGIASLAQSGAGSPDGGGAAMPAQAEQGEPGPVVRQQTRDDLELSMVIAPGFAGANSLSFYLIDSDRDWTEVRRFTVRLSHNQSGRRQAYDLEQLHEGHFPLDYFELAFAGAWSAEVSVVREDAGETAFRFEFVLSHP
jgi:hypothetical protein